MKRRKPAIIDLATHPESTVSPQQLADYLDCDVRTIRRMIPSSLRAFRLGRDWRIPTDEARRVFHVKQTSQGIAQHDRHKALAR